MDFKDKAKKGVSGMLAASMLVTPAVNVVNATNEIKSNIETEKETTIKKPETKKEAKKLLDETSKKELEKRENLEKAKKDLENTEKEIMVQEENFAKAEEDKDAKENELNEAINQKKTRGKRCF